MPWHCHKCAVEKMKSQKSLQHKFPPIEIHIPFIRHQPTDYADYQSFVSKYYINEHAALLSNETKYDLDKELCNRNWTGSKMRAIARPDYQEYFRRPCRDMSGNYIWTCSIVDQLVVPQDRDGGLRADKVWILEIPASNSGDHSGGKCRS